MFKEEILETPLSCAAADSYFGNSLRGAGVIFGDASLISTMRALLYDKIDDSDNQYTYRVRSSDTRKFDEVITAIINSERFIQSSTLHIYVNRNTEMKIDTGYLAERLPAGWEFVDRVQNFFQKHFDSCYVMNQKMQSGILILNCTSRAQWHFMQCALVGMMPWFFPDPKELDDDRLDLIRSLSEKDSEKYYEIISRIADKIDFYGKFLTKSLKGFESNYDSQRLRDIESDIASIRSDIEQYMRYISDYSATIREKQMLWNALDQKIRSGGSENDLLEYFRSNKHVKLVDASESYIKFVAHGYLTFFDEFLADTYIENKNSVLYAYLNVNGASEEDLKKFYTALFLERRIKIKVCASYIVYARGPEIDPVRHCDYPKEFSYYMPNPHIDQYECIGNFAQIFTECAKAGDYVRMVEQAIVSSQSLNFNDGTVLCRFLEILNGYNTGNTHSKECIELPDGSMVDAAGAIKWLKESEVAHE